MENKHKYFISLGIGLVLAALIACWRGFGLSRQTYENCGFLSDGGFVIGVLFMCIGVLTKASESGFFDIFAYGTKSFFGRFFHPSRMDDDYYSYRQKKGEDRKPALYHLLYAGLTLVAISVIMLILYSVLAPQA